ncbi:MAG TPA: penicillin-binding protein 2 [Candidatus Limnocylindrales bacterium]|jgi:cell division protein FtsI/penicillin-binding protein 2|nr:penicillin-binding protein 2 [Candidatus Limnocylindrales bacterium]
MGRTDSRGRALVLLIAFAVVGSALLARLAYWQVGQRDFLAEEALQQTTMKETTPSRRGDIYDRTGVVVLATTIERERLIANPSQIKDPARRREVAERLVSLLNLTGDDAAQLTTRVTSEKKYVILAHGIDTTTGDRIRAAIADKAIEGVALESEPVRVYPQPGGGPETTLAANLLGFVNRDGVGQYGVEQFYQDQLAGRPKVVQAQRDIAARSIPETTIVKDPGQPGEDIRLTIDAGLQLAVEQEILAAWAADRAKSVSAVVMDPYTGEVLAEASYPSYDGNDYARIAATDPSRFIDPVVSSVYEPGSVFKMLTSVAALESGEVTTQTKIKDTGLLKLDGGRTHVDDADHKAMGWMTFEDAIAYSRNVVAAKVAIGLDPSVRRASATLYSTWSRFGFGKKTGIDLAGEVSGIVRDPALHSWREIDLANGAFGQGVAVTPIQLATAYSAMLNGGTQVTPRVVKAVGMTEARSANGPRLISQGLSTTLTGMMHHVVATVPFYRDRTLIKGYDVGGKTGTAQIWDATANHGRGAWKTNLFNYSFIGYIAREAGKPDLVVAIRIEEGKPTIHKLGQLEMPVMSFELFRRIAHDAITTPDLLGTRTVPPDATTASR